MKENFDFIYPILHINGQVLVSTSFTICLGTSGVESLQLLPVWNLQMNLEDKFQALQQVSESQIHLKLALKDVFSRKHKTFERDTEGKLS